MNCAERRNRDGGTIAVIDRNAHAFMHEVGLREEHFLRDYSGELI